MKIEYSSNQEFFEDLIKYQKELVESGHCPAAQIINEGMGCIDGLTDGWEFFMESLETVATEFAAEFSAAQQEKLTKLLAISKKVVYRK